MNELKPHLAEQVTRSAKAELAEVDVMRALELHADCETDNCFECPYEGYLSQADGNCVHHLSTDALALLREKDATLEMCAETIERQDKELAKKDAEIERLRKANQHFAELENGHIVTGYKNIRTEAITEFAERLKSEVNGGQFASYKGLEIRNVIDQIAKEMKEQGHGEK